MISNTSITKNLVTNIDAARRRHRRVCDHAHCHFDWGHVALDSIKVAKVIRCRKPADRIFLQQVLAASQRTIPRWAVWDALEAVKQIGPDKPVAYFRTVLKDDCRKAGVDLYEAIRGIKVPANLPWYRPGQRRTTPLPDEALRLCADELKKVIP